jgi:hypothetical protein
MKKFIDPVKDVLKDDVKGVRFPKTYRYGLLPRQR